MEEQQQLEIDSSHFCQICKRRFASGRALGGHMRIHGAAASQFNSRPFVHEDCRHKMCRLSETNTSGSSASMDEREASQDGGQDFRGDGSCVAADSAFNKNGSSVYALRPNPKRSRRFADGEYSILVPPAQPQGCVSKSTGFTLSKNSRVCEECGKEFSSWKALIDHGRCHSDLMSETHPHADHEYWERVLHSQSGNRSFAGSLGQRSNMKGKRSKRLRYVVEPQHQSCSNEQQPSQYNVEADTAYCLVMLSTASDFWGSGDAQHRAEELQSATSPSTHRKIPITTEHASGLDKIRKSRSRAKSTDCESDPSHNLRSDESKKTAYECKACKKKFDSFQALGGHRASHNKPLKGCPSRKDAVHDEGDESLGLESGGHQNASGAETNLWNKFSKPPIRKDRVRESSYNEEIDESPFSSKKAAKVHKCSICHRIFYSGQALGGHKRCHWLTAGTSDTTTTSSTISTSKDSPPRQQPPGGQLLDLNLPAPFDDDDGCTHVQH